MKTLLAASAIITSEPMKLALYTLCSFAFGFVAVSHFVG
jgi:hypothetical protein